MSMIRPEQPNDRSAILALHTTCFPTGAEARLVDLLREAGRLSVSRVAEVDGEVVGHIAFSPVTTAFGTIGAGLAPLAVSPSNQRRGVGGALVESGLAACRSAGFGWAVVLGDPQYYGRFGFQPASDVGLSDEYGGGDAFQVIELTPGTLPVREGVVRYAAEFASLGE